MKQKIFLLGALALGLLSCQRTPQALDNPAYDREENTVNTQFVLSIDAGRGAETKQSAEDVQADGYTSFRGIDAVHILPYSLDYDNGGAHYLFKVSDPSSVATRDFDLGALVRKDDISASDTRRIVELALPLETNSILFYGRAAKTKTDDEQGVIEAAGTALNTPVSNISFKLKNRLQNKAAFDQFTDLMGRVLTGIMNGGLVDQTAALGYKNPKDGTYKFWWPFVQVGEKTNNDYIEEVGSAWYAKDGDGNYIADKTEREIDGQTYTFYHGSITWKKLGEDYVAGTPQMNPLQEVLGEAYSTIMSLRTKQEGELTYTELRAGSSASLLRLTSDLYKILKRVLTSTAVTPDDYIAQLLTQEIIARARFFYAVDGEDRVTFQPVNIIMDGVHTVIPEREPSNYTLITNDFFYQEAQGSTPERPGFPVNLGMPLGSALLTFLDPAITHTDFIVVSYLNAIPAYGMSGGALPITNYRYPAELMYYTNSPLRVTDDPVDRLKFPGAAANWSKDEYWSNIWENNGTVKSTTRGVAIAKAVNYGTALLKSTVAYTSDVVYDNNSEIHTSEPSNTVDVSSPNKFTVTGIMIGGACEEVGWDFIPKNNSFNTMIYDRCSPAFSIPAYVSGSQSYSAPFYTLCFDNYSVGTDPSATPSINNQSKVYVALELINNSGQDLWGELNLIRQGGTFYLVGVLDPKADNATKNLKKDANGQVDLSRTDFFYPPFDENGNTLSIPRVFMQDYATSVKFKFTPESLKHAYVTMPDLRSGQISLGLSVDLMWEPGMDFEVALGGN